MNKVTGLLPLLGISAFAVGCNIAVRVLHDDTVYADSAAQMDYAIALSEQFSSIEILEAAEARLKLDYESVSIDEPEVVETTETPETTTTAVTYDTVVETTVPYEVTEIGGEPIYDWLGRIPEEYGEGSGCTRAEASRVAIAMREVGASDESIEWMLYVISRESLCDPAAHNGNRNTGDDSWGLCQQNNLSGWFNEGKLLENFDRFAFANDFDLNARSCAAMWAECSKGPWTRGDYGCYTPKELR